ncbi:MAG TPA: hypothetical protein VEU47_13030 [Candidatus Cybelea sp.]|nr:hypothetical protein [Candidatus Cybelea sp.]
MKMFVASAVAGFLLIGGAASAPAATAIEYAPEGSYMKLSDSGDFATTRNEYEHKARRQIDEWQQKMSRFGDDAKDTASKAADSAEARLRVAWGDVKQRWEQLESASADGWDKARAAFEKASNRMKEAWNKAHPEK